jgi:hypothetical protein
MHKLYLKDRGTTLKWNIYLIKREYAIFSNKNNVGERLNIYLGSNVARRVGKDDRLVKDQY